MRYVAYNVTGPLGLGRVDVSAAESQSGSETGQPSLSLLSLALSNPIASSFALPRFAMRFLSLSVARSARLFRVA